jgi:anthranilate synthase/aminodeoxychorismate synthase-like glutamine amidotransferase
VHRSHSLNRMLLLIDNYDSFTYNLVLMLRELSGEMVQVYHNDAISVAQVIQARPSHIVISPGPGRPESAGISLELIKAVSGQIPLLGVCLGHQAIASAFGAHIRFADAVMHGKTSLIHHGGRGIFSGMPQPFTAMRYHSLVIDPASLVDDLVVTAWADTDQIMGIEHRHYPLAGVQFHPESIATEQGHQLLKNFLSIV